MKINFIENNGIYTFPNDKPPYCDYKINNITIKKIKIESNYSDDYLNEIVTVFGNTEKDFENTKNLKIENGNNNNKKFIFKIPFCAQFSFQNNDNNEIEEVIEEFQKVLKEKEKEEIIEEDPFANWFELKQKRA